MSQTETILFTYKFTMAVIMAFKMLNYALSTKLYLQVSDNQYGTHSLKQKFFSELRVRECK